MGTRNKKKNLVSKVIKWTGIGFVVILALLIVLPYVFKDKIVQMIKDTANENLTATLDFGEVDLSLISTFPYFSMEINDLSVSGKDRFEGVNLVKVKKMAVNFNLQSVIAGDYTIKSVAIDGADIYVKVLEDGIANYDIVKADTTAVEEEQPTETEESGDFKFDLSHYEITNSNIVYDDATLPTYVAIKNLNHTGQVSIDNDLYSVVTKTVIDEFTTRYDGVDYLKKVHTDIDFVVDMDMEKGRYEFKENNVALNDLGLHFDGWVEMPEEYINMDITYGTTKQTFKSLLSMVPGAYTADFKDLETNGTLELNGYVKGKMDTVVMPAFDLNLKVADAWFKYPDLPSKLDKIAVDLNINRKEGSDLNNTIVNLKKMHAEFDDNTLDAKLLVKNTMTDPHINSDIKAYVDLAKLKNVIPVSEGENYNGIITSDVHLNGALSTLENEEYDKFDATGDLKIQEMLYQSPDLSYDVKIDSMLFLFSPQNLKLASFDAKIGESDIQAQGTIDNYMQYYLKDETLKGSFDVSSTYFNMDELMYEEVATTEEPPVVEAQATETADTVEAGVIDIPKNIDFALNTDIKKLSYDGLELTNMKGAVRLKEGVASLKDVSMNTLGGELKVNGDYYAITPKKAHVDFKYDVKNMSIQKSFEYVNTVQKLAPIAKYCTGNFSTKLALNTDIDENFEPIYETIDGAGNFLTNQVTVKGFPVLEKIAEVTKIQDLKEQTIDNLKILYELREGKIWVDTFPVKLSGIESKIAGTTAITEEIDYLIKMKVPREKLGNQANQLVEGLLGKASSKGVNLEISDLIPLNIRIGGTVMNPKIVTGLEGGNMAGNLADQGKEMLKDKLNEEAQKIMEEAQRQADKINEEAKIAADKVRAEAKAAADKVREEGREAAEKARAEARAEIQKQKEAGYAEADKLVAEASNPIAKKVAEKAAEKLRQKTDEKVANLNKTVDAKGDKIEAEANKKAQKIEDEGEAKAQKIEAEAKQKSDLILQNAQQKVDNMNAK